MTGDQRSTTKNNTLLYLRDTELAHVFSQLSRTDRLGARLVCQRFKRLLPINKIVRICDEGDSLFAVTHSIPMTATLSKDDMEEFASKMTGNEHYPKLIKQLDLESIVIKGSMETQSVEASICGNCSLIISLLRRADASVTLRDSLLIRVPAESLSTGLRIKLVITADWLDELSSYVSKHSICSQIIDAVDISRVPTKLFGILRNILSKLPNISSITLSHKHLGHGLIPEKTKTMGLALHKEKWVQQSLVWLSHNQHLVSCIQALDMRSCDVTGTSRDALNSLLKFLTYLRSVQLRDLLNNAEISIPNTLTDLRDLRVGAIRNGGKLRIDEDSGLRHTGICSNESGGKLSLRRLSIGCVMRGASLEASEGLESKQIRIGTIEDGQVVTLPERLKKRCIIERGAQNVRWVQKNPSLAPLLLATGVFLLVFIESL